MTLKILRDKLTFALLVLISTIHHLLAQDQLNELTVDRPGIAESPFTVSPGMYQFETGFEFYKRDSGSIYYLPTILFRTGLSKSAELRITVRELVDRTRVDPLHGIAPLNIGVKVHIIEQAGWIPETDILTNLIIPVGPSKLNPDRLGHEILLLFQHDFTPKTAINYNVGYSWDGFRQREIFTASVCFNYLPTSRSGLFVEYFTFSTERPGEHGIDGGMTYLLRPRLQLDFSVGISRIEKENNYFISSGFSFRLERQKHRPSLVK